MVWQSPRIGNGLPEKCEAFNKLCIAAESAQTTPYVVDASAAESLSALRRVTDAALLSMSNARQNGSQIEESRRLMQAALAALCASSLSSIARTSKMHDISLRGACQSAVKKVQWRTPYMQPWGDAKPAADLEEAMAHWAARKKDKTSRTAMSFRPEESFHGYATSSSDAMLCTIATLTLPGQDGCPWTRTRTPEEMIGYIKEEIGETIDEVRILGVADTIQGATTDALVSELGDVLFSVVMAVFLAARDFHVDVTGVFQAALPMVE